MPEGAGHYGAPVTGFTPRLRWTDLDPEARGAVELAVQSATGATVAEAHDVHGGMSPGPAAVVTTTGGQEVFVKVTSSDLNEKSCQLYRDEIAAYRALAHLELPMPALLSVVEHGPWIGLVLTRAAGRTPGPPWHAAALDDVRDAAARVNALTAPDAVPPVLQRLPRLDGWEVLTTDPPVPLDGWLAENARRCAYLVRGWETWTAGRTLTHNDLRCDNVLWSSDGCTTLVDWNFSSAAAPWLDLAQLATDVMASGIEGDDDAACALEQSLGLLSGTSEDASRFVLALAGMLRRNSALPPHPALPTMRAWQASRADRLQPLVEELVPALLS